MEENIRQLIKKVRKWCIIATVIVLIVGIILTAIKIGAIGGAASGGMNEINEMVTGESDPEGAGRVFGGILGFFTVGIGIFVVFALIMIGIIKTVAIILIIWIVFLIFYIVQRIRIKKLNDKPTQDEKSPENQVVVEQKPLENQTIEEQKPLESQNLEDQEQQGNN
ncbi:MAG: hypothetical protein IKI57_00370 [Clostridia bacterium]|nr:hypothetical protein [Clostridia bacterium]